MSQAAAVPFRWRRSPAAIAVQVVALNLLLQAAVVALGTLGALDWFALGTARATHALYTATGLPSTLIADKIYLAHHVLTINADCTGLFVYAGYVALVLAWPSRAVTVARALAFGLPALVVANLIRLGVVGHVSERLPGAFDLIHDVLFRVVMVLLALLLWYFFSVREQTPQQALPAARR